MNVVCSICEHEKPMAHRFFDWLQELGGTEGHRLFLIPASGVDIIDIFPKANTAFHNQVTVIIDYEAETCDWQDTNPMRSASGPNSSFRQIAWYFYHNKGGPWFWCELDCIPLKKDWLNRLASEYQVALSKGKQFLGAHVQIENVPEHMSGNAVYPQDVPAIAPTLVMRTEWTPKGQSKAFELAFDIAGAREVVPKAHFTNLIQHKFRYEGFKSKEEFDAIIDPNAVVFHSDKNGTIYPYLRANLSGGVESRHAKYQDVTKAQLRSTPENEWEQTSDEALPKGNVTEERLKMTVSGSSAPPAQKILKDGVWVLEGEQTEKDPNLLPLILDYINEGDTVIDAGSWIGGHTMEYLKKVGEKGAVHAFEPNPAAYDCLVHNTKTDCHRVALGDKDCMVSLSVEKGRYDSAYVGNGQQIGYVPMKPLDNYNFAPNLIKIDVEGCELKVLKGAEKTIKKYHPRMVIEINAEALKRQGSTPEEVKNWLYSNNYTLNIVGSEDNPDIYNILATHVKPVATRILVSSELEQVISQNAVIQNGLPAMSPPWENREDTEKDVKMLCDALALFTKAPIYKSRVRQALREAKIIK